MKGIAINGDPRKEGNTQVVVKSMADEPARHGIETRSCSDRAKT